MSVPSHSTLEPNALAPSESLLDALADDCDRAPAEVAIGIAERFVARWPAHPFGWSMLAESYHRAGQFPAAAHAAEEAARRNPGSAVAQANLGVMLQHAGRLAEARQAQRAALRLDPDCAAAHANLAVLLRQQGRLEEAAAACRAALELAPGLLQCHNNLGNILQDLGQTEAAQAAYRALLAQCPTHPEALANLAALLTERGQPEPAEALLRQALAARPDYARAYVKLGAALADLDRLDEAERAYRQALALAPADGEAHGNLLFCLAYMGNIAPEAMRAEAARWETRALDAAELTAAANRRFARAPSRGRRLRLGVLSAEFGDHPVGYFLKPWLTALDPERVEVRLYPTSPRPALQRAEFRALGSAWQPLVGLDDRQAADKLRADQLDVLVETSGHTAHNRLGVLAHRVAPVQCHYLGYFATTGLTAMDYFLGDAVLIPPEHDAHFVEQVWRLPRSRYAYAPPCDAPPPERRPAPDGRLWLGSFNNLAKVREASLVLWAEALRALPAAGLLLKDRKTGDAAVRARILDTLARHGVAAERVRFLPHAADWRAHMACYQEMDIALDSLPFNSATTGFEALWMGVPLVTLAGDRLSGRQAASLLTGLGRPEWIATDPRGFIETVIALAHDAEGRAAVRQQQREQMRASELCDGVGLARVLEQTWGEMFDRWQAQQATLRPNRVR